MSDRLKYRPEIDGLRALAVLPVIQFHAGSELFSGGFIGVDVFFVISGYLITSIIIEELQDETFTLARFYERRARRILPALFFVILCCIPFAWLWMTPPEFKDFATSIGAIVFFSSNVLFWWQSGYFDTSAELKPLLHTWSLGVEEQFYILFPVFLLLAWRFMKNRVHIAIAIFAIIGLMITEYESYRHPSFNFYWAPMRAWELLFGSCCALLRINSHPTRDKILSTIGFASIVISYFLFNEHSRLPSMLSLLPVLGTGLVLLYASPLTPVGMLLSTRPLVGIGLISYSAYLWHQPILSFARIRSLSEPSTELLLGLPILVLLLAYFSWKYIELPFRKSGNLARKAFPAAAIGCATAAGLIGFSAFGYLSNGFPARIPNAVKRFAAYGRDHNPRREECLAMVEKPIIPQQSCTYGASGKATIAVVGDSHANAAVHELGKRFSHERLSLRELTKSGCPPAPHYERNLFTQNSIKRHGCSQYYELTTDFLRADPDIDTVIFIARWTTYLEQSTFDNKEGGKEPFFSTDGYLLEDDGNTSSTLEAMIAKKYREAVEKQINAGKRVVLVYPIPEAGWNVPRHLARVSLLRANIDRPLSTSYGVFQDRNRRSHEALDAIGDADNLVRVRPESVFCNSPLKGRCILEQQGVPLYHDDDHLSSAGAALLADEIIETMRKKGWLKPILRVQ